jgi:hypothetical protein
MNKSPTSQITEDLLNLYAKDKSLLSARGSVRSANIASSQSAAASVLTRRSGASAAVFLSSSGGFVSEMEQRLLRSDG